ncbi:unnamed protein product [Symbiodinium sp. KB8]|nr:unnamed protein product [Symbiodinium sp. KB8]
MAPNGYLTALAQSALLEAYGGGALAAAAQALADEVRATFAPLRDPAADQRRRPRRSRRRRHASHLSGDACPMDIDSGVAVPTCPPLATSTSEAAWEALDELDLREELRHPTPTLQDVPPFMRAAVRNALTSALARLRAADVAGHSTGWQGRALLLARAAAFQRGVWRQLFAAARPGTRDPEPPMELDPAVAFERKRQRACAKVRQGEFTRARQVLTAAELAPGTEATWVALTDPTKRPPEVFDNATRPYQFACARGAGASWHGRAKSGARARITGSADSVAIGQAWGASDSFVVRSGAHGEEEPAALQDNQASLSRGLVPSPHRFLQLGDAITLSLDGPAFVTPSRAARARSGKAARDMESHVLRPSSDTRTERGRTDEAARTLAASVACDNLCLCTATPTCGPLHDCGLLARRAKIVERVWVRVAGKRWSRLDLVVYGALSNGGEGRKRVLGSEAVASAALGGAWLQPLQPEAGEGQKAARKMQSYALRPCNETTVACGSGSEVTRERAVSASTPALALAYWNGRVASSNTGVQAAASVRETRRRNVSPVGNAADPTARFLEGRHAGHRKAFGNQARHVCSSQASGRFGEKCEGIRMLQEQLVMLWPCAGQARGAASLALPKRPSDCGRGEGHPGGRLELCWHGLSRQRRPFRCVCQRGKGRSITGS